MGFCLASSIKVKDILTDLWPTDPQHAASSLSHPFASLQELLLTSAEVKHFLVLRD